MITALSSRDGKMMYSVTYHEGERLTGAVLMTEGDGWMRIYNVYVEPPSRGKGAASAMLKEALEFKPKLKYCVDVDSFCEDGAPEGLNDQQLRAWYERLGFKAVPSHPFAMVYERSE